MVACLYCMYPCEWVATSARVYEPSCPKLSGIVPSTPATQVRISGMHKRWINVAYQSHQSQFCFHIKHHWSSILLCWIPDCFCYCSPLQRRHTQLRFRIHQRKIQKARRWGKKYKGESASTYVDHNCSTTDHCVWHAARWQSLAANKHVFLSLHLKFFCIMGLLVVWIYLHRHELILNPFRRVGGCQMIE